MSTETDRGHAKILLEIALQFGATLNLDQLLPLVLERMTSFLEADRALFALIDGRGRIERVVTHNLDWEERDKPLPVSHGLLTQVMKTGKTVVVPDAQLDVEFQTRNSVKALGLRFMLGAPVHVSGRVGGVLAVDSGSAAAVDPREKLELLTALARLVGTALENARLFEEQRFRHRLLADLVHDFRTPLNVILLNSRTIAMDPSDLDEVKEMATDIVASVHRMEKMVEYTLEVSCIDAGVIGPVPEPLDLTKAVPAQIRSFDLLARHFDLELEVHTIPDLPQAMTLPDRLWLVLDNLIFNAFKHARRNSVVTVSVRSRSDAGPAEARKRPSTESAALFQRVTPLEPSPSARFLEVSVHNEGTPIPAALQPELFTPYRKGEPAKRTVRSTGLGLSIVDQCVQCLGGSVWVTSSEKEGTTFCFTIPDRVRLERYTEPPGPAA